MAPSLSGGLCPTLQTSVVQASGVCRSRVTVPNTDPRLAPFTKPVSIRDEKQLCLQQWAHLKGPHREEWLQLSHLPGLGNFL